jgi:hypothetical protein
LNTSQLAVNTTTSTTAVFNNATVSGPGDATFIGNVIRFPKAGTYLLNIQLSTASGSISSTYAGATATNAWTVSSAVSVNYSATVEIIENGTVTLTVTGTMSSIKVLLAPFDLSL